MAEVNDLLKAYTKFEEMVKKVGKMRFKQMAKDPSAMMRGPVDHLISLPLSLHLGLE